MLSLTSPSTPNKVRERARQSAVSLGSQHIRGGSRRIRNSRTSSAIYWVWNQPGKYKNKQKLKGKLSSLCLACTRSQIRSLSPRQGCKGEIEDEMTILSPSQTKALESHQWLARNPMLPSLWASTPTHTPLLPSPAPPRLDWNCSVSRQCDRQSSEPILPFSFPWERKGSSSFTGQEQGRVGCQPNSVP